MLLKTDPEWAHELTLRALEIGLYKRDTETDNPCLKTNIMGLQFPNPIGIAAGFDKDARVYNAVQDVGFGFSEVGTLTPRPQSGNIKPRVIRLPKDKALINRLGFNNCGHDTAHHRLIQRKPSGILGINIGANKDTTEKAIDYTTGIKRFYSLADYFMINISSPNTPGLRDLQSPEQLSVLLRQINDIRDRCADKYGRFVPIAIKLAPEIAYSDMLGIVDKIVSHNIDAIAVSNTTISRPSNLKTKLVEENGGLSGQPLFQRSTVVLARIHKHVNGTIPLIGIGGINSGESAQAKIEAGASLIQLYTGLIYGGLPVLKQIKSQLVRATQKASLAQLKELTGTNADTWASLPLD